MALAGRVGAQGARDSPFSGEAGVEAIEYAYGQGDCLKREVGSCQNRLDSSNRWSR